MTATALPSTMRALVIKEQGDIDVMNVEDDVSLPTLSDGEVLVKTTYAGVNFIDTYQRAGVYKIATPATLGNEVAGMVEKLGPGVTPESAGFAVGDRVAAYIALTGFGQYSRAPAVRTYKLPSDVNDKDAATILLQGLTALTFVNEAHAVKRDEYVLIHAAAGGLGLILCQICAHKGAHVIGTVSTEDKARLAKANGAEHIVLYRDVPFDEVANQVIALTPNSEGVHAVFDGVGKDTFECSLQAVRRKGSLVSIGNASGAIEPFAPLRLGAKNVKLSRPVLTHYVTTREEFQHYADELFQLVRDGHVRLARFKEDGYDFTTESIRQAHRDISSRGTTGKLLVKIA